LDETALECLDFGLNAQQAAVMLQKSRAFVEARSPVLSGPIGATIRRIEGAIFSGFSRFSSADPCTRISERQPVTDDSISRRLIFRIRSPPCRFSFSRNACGSNFVNKAAGTVHP